jgi:hypothetical protein
MKVEVGWVYENRHGWRYKVLAINSAGDIEYQVLSPPDLAGRKGLCQWESFEARMMRRVPGNAPREVSHAF